jgi:sRNA-binding protein
VTKSAKMEKSDISSSSSASPPEKAITNIGVGDCPISTVVVYTSRLAEVTRRLKTTLAKGTTEIHVTGLVPGVNGDSFRVSAGSAAKSAVILEVRI